MKARLKKQNEHIGKTNGRIIQTGKDYGEITIHFEHINSTAKQGFRDVQDLDMVILKNRN